MTTKFSNAAKNYGLQISITKTEVMYQPAPGKPYVEPTITIDNLQLPKPATAYHEAIQISRQCAVK